MTESCLQSKKKKNHAKLLDVVSSGTVMLSTFSSKNMLIFLVLGSWSMDVHNPKKKNLFFFLKIVQVLIYMFTQYL